MPEYTPPPGSGGGGGGGGSITLDEAYDNGNEITVTGSSTPVKISGTTAPLLLIEGNSSSTAQVQLRSNSQKHFLEAESSGLLSVTGQKNLTLGVAVTSPGAGEGEVTIGPSDGKMVIIPDGKAGLSIGDAPPTFGGNSLSVGSSHVEASAGSLVVGTSCAAATNSLSVGDTNTAVAGSVCFGSRSENGGLYDTAPVIALANNNSVALTYSPNTVVIDSGSQNPETGAAPGSPSVEPIGSDAGTLSGIGNIYLDSGSVGTNNADYAEMFEWNDGNTNNADRRGFFVSLTNGNKIVVGNSDVIGVVSSRPVIIGDAAEISWTGRYERDEFGGILYDVIDNQKVPRQSSNFDPKQRYKPRRARKEWGTIGLLGKLYVRSAQALTAGNKCSANSSGYAVSGNDYRILRVIRQPTPSLYGIIEILMK